MEKYCEIFSLQSFVIAIYVLKVKFDFSKKISGLMIFISNLQPLFFIFELQNTNLARTLALRMDKSNENRSNFMLTIYSKLLIDNIYILHYQAYPNIFAISINLSFSISILIVSTSDAQFVKFCSLIMFSLILTILLNLNKKIESESILQLFKTRKTNFNYLRYGLIKILNHEIYFQKEDLMIKILIAKLHSSRCKSKQCSFCNHLSIQNPGQCCGITNEMFKQFVLFTISTFLQKPPKNRKKPFKMNKLQSILTFYLILDGQLDLLKSLIIFFKQNALLITKLLFLGSKSIASQIIRK